MIKVRKSIKQSKSTDIGLMVESIAQEELMSYDKQKIVDALVKELGCPLGMAKDVANEVTEKIEQLELDTITTSLIRSFVNVVLYEKGFDKELKPSSEIAIPLHDVTELIENATKENGNTTHNPESINLAIAERVLKEYALKNRDIFNENVSKAHLEGKIHIHDGGMITRLYAFDGTRNVVRIRNKKTRQIQEVTFERLYYLMKQEEYSPEEGVYIKETNKYEIQDKDGWTDIEKLTKMIEQKDIYEVEVESGEKIYITEEHACIKIEDDGTETEVPLCALQEGDHFYVREPHTNRMKLSKIKSIKKIDTVDTIYDITTKSHTLVCNDIYTHNCSGHSIEYIKKHGLKNIPNITSTSRPANSAWVLARHVCSATQFFTSIFAGAIGFEAVNMFFAPMLRGWKYKDIKQLAQTLIFDLSQLAGAKGGQCAFTDFNIYIDIPNHYKNVYAMGKSGQYMVDNGIGQITYFRERKDAEEFAAKHDYKILRYKDFENESKLFAKALLEVAKEGDAIGMPFAFPKLNLHINSNTFKTPQSRELLMLACEASSEKGCPYFIFDRNEFQISQCCRLSIKFTEKDKKLVDTPEELRFVGGQNVSINLPNIALQYQDEDEFYSELYHRMDLACQAHVERIDYAKRLAELPNSPLRFYKYGMDGKPYVRFDNITYLIGIVGLNECVYNLTGQELHESKEAFQKGMEIIAFMNMQLEGLGEKYGLRNLNLEETPAESTANRFAKLDIKKYGDKAFVKSNEFGEYYSNSVHFAADSDVDYITRLIEQSKFHPLVDAGSMIHIWAGENKPSPQAIYNLVKATWDNTQCVQWVLSPEYTSCKNCSKTSNGLHDTCPYCDSENVVQITRITGYYVIIDNFNPGKRAELEDRKREMVEEENSI